MTPRRASRVLAGARGRRILLVGDLMMDEWVFGSVKRISPEAPIPVVTMPLTREARADKPGGAGNVAAILLGLGAAVKVVGAVGEDDLGNRLVADLESRGADVSGVLRDASRPTTHKLRILAGRQQLLRVDTEKAEPLEADLAGRVRDLLRASLAQAEAVLVADYAKGVVTSESLPADAIAGARRAAVPFCADPKPGNMELFRGASLVSPNEAEALLACGPVPAGQTESKGVLRMPVGVAQAGRDLLKRLGAEAVFITRGDQGMAVFLEDGQIAEVPVSGKSGEVGDGTGCGDAVSAMSALALAAGAGYLEAAELANAAGGVVSRFVGVHSPSPSEIIEWLG
jgi:D-beta-D-heptose 7-phosphate kinase/D-beta-D-heptose 1-phosphate adenosyltransferase